MTIKYITHNTTPQDVNQLLENKQAYKSLRLRIYAFLYSSNHSDVISQIDDIVSQIITETIAYCKNKNLVINYDDLVTLSLSIAHRKKVDVIRYRKRRNTDPFPVEVIEQSSQPFCDEYFKYQQTQNFKELISSLDKVKSQMIYDRFVNNLKDVQIAKKYNVKPSTVRVYRIRAYETIRKTLEPTK